MKPSLLTVVKSNKKDASFGSIKYKERLRQGFRCVVEYQGNSNIADRKLLVYGIAVSQYGLVVGGKTPSE